MTLISSLGQQRLSVWAGQGAEILLHGQSNLNSHTRNSRMRNHNLCQIAQSANDYASGWMTRQSAVKEESITDWLLDYFHQNSRDIEYYQFSRHEEGRYSGADWDWWFLLGRGCFKLRIQAKKLRMRHNHYGDLARSNKSGLQIDMLLESSVKYNFYPLYALFGHRDGPGRCDLGPDLIVLSICAAQEVYDLLFNSPRCRIDSRKLSDLSIPLHCLFCCSLTEPDNQGPRQLLEHYFRVPRRTLEGEPEGDPNRGFEESVPSIIQTLFEIREVNSNTEEILSEYQSMFAGSSGVSIVRVSDMDRG